MLADHQWKVASLPAAKDCYRVDHPHKATSRPLAGNLLLVRGQADHRPPRPWRPAMD